MPFFARFPFVLGTFAPLPLFPYASPFIRPLFALYSDFNLYS